jgi:hypothetical protein
MFLYHLYRLYPGVYKFQALFRTATNFFPVVSNFLNVNTALSPTPAPPPTYQNVYQFARNDHISTDHGEDHRSIWNLVSRYGNFVVSPFCSLQLGRNFWKLCGSHGKDDKWGFGLEFWEGNEKKSAANLTSKSPVICLEALTKTI